VLPTVPFIVTVELTGQQLVDVHFFSFIVVYCCTLILLINAIKCYSNTTVFTVLAQNLTLSLIFICLAIRNSSLHTRIAEGFSRMDQKRAVQYLQLQ
jgi:hypothetical protein